MQEASGGAEAACGVREERRTSRTPPAASTRGGTLAAQQLAALVVVLAVLVVGLAELVVGLAEPVVLVEPQAVGYVADAWRPRARWGGRRGGRAARGERGKTPT